ncbi:MAG: hypothetical protein HYU00_05170 [Nitrosarchaeum sp.]|nr:hypothetical protein [Nitrosarchaeum sp.]
MRSAINGYDNSPGQVEHIAGIRLRLEALLSDHLRENQVQQQTAEALTALELSNSPVNPTTSEEIRKEIDEAVSAVDDRINELSSDSSKGDVLKLLNDLRTSLENINNEFINVNYQEKKDDRAKFLEVVNSFPNLVQKELFAFEGRKAYSIAAVLFGIKPVLYDYGYGYDYFVDAFPDRIVRFNAGIANIDSVIKVIKENPDIFRDFDFDVYNSEESKKADYGTGMMSYPYGGKNYLITYLGSVKGWASSSLRENNIKAGLLFGYPKSAVFSIGKKNGENKKLNYDNYGIQFGYFPENAEEVKAFDDRLKNAFETSGIGRLIESKILELSFSEFFDNILLQSNIQLSQIDSDNLKQELINARASKKGAELAEAFKSALGDHYTKDLLSSLLTAHYTELIETAYSKENEVDEINKINDELNQNSFINSDYFTSNDREKLNAVRTQIYGGLVEVNDKYEKDDFSHGRRSPSNLD